MKKLIRKFLKQETGFSLLEIMVAVSLFSFLVLASGSIYILLQRAYNQGADKGEMTQNLRVALDRISRELRQAAGIATVLPPTESEPGNPPPQEIIFQDGHNPEVITYLRYYLDGSDLKRSQLAYYFSADPETYVLRGSMDQGGNPPLELILEDKIVGEYFSGLRFWGENNLVYIKINLNKNGRQLETTAGIYARN